MGLGSSLRKLGSVGTDLTMYGTGAGFIPGANDAVKDKLGLQSSTNLGSTAQDIAGTAAQAAAYGTGVGFIPGVSDWAKERGRGAVAPGTNFISDPSARTALGLGGAATGFMIGGPLAADLGYKTGSNAGQTISDIATGASNLGQGIAEIYDPTDISAGTVSAGMSEMSPEQASFLQALRSKYESGTTLPSVAQEQLRQSTADTAAAASGLLGSIRGVQNPALLGRQAANAQTTAMMKGAGESAILRAQEAADAQKAKAVQESQLLNAYEANRQANIEKEKLQTSLKQSAMEANAKQKAEALKARSELVGNIGSGLLSAFIPGAGTKK